MSDITRTFTDAQLGLRERHRRTKRNPINPVLAFFREQAANASSWGAKNFGIVSAKYKRHSYLICYHDGEGFPTSQTVFDCLHPSSAFGNKGLMGNGGKLSGILLVNKNDNYHMCVYSACLDGTHCAFDLKIKGRKPVVKNADNVIHEFLTPVLKGAKFKPSVIYMHRFDVVGDEKALQTISTMNSYGLFAPSTLSKGMKIYFGNGVLVDPGFNSIDVATKGNKNKIYSDLGASYSYQDGAGGKYTHVEVAPYSDIRNKFCPENYRFKYGFSGCDVSLNGEKFTLEGNLFVDVYPGLCKKRHDSQGLIPLQGAGKASHQYQPIEDSTYLILNCFEDEASVRLSQDPVFVGNMNTPLATEMQLPIIESIPKITNDLNDFSGKGFLGYDLSLKDKEKQTKLYRSPFIVLKFEVTNVVADLSRSEPERRNALGGIDELFTSIDRSKSRKIIKGIGIHVAEKHNLNSLKKCLREVYPLTVDNLAPLDFESKTVGCKVEFIPEKGPRKIVEPSQTYTGALKYVDSGLDVDGSDQIEALSEGFVLSFMGDGCWALRILPLSLRLNDGSKREVLEEEWLKANRYDRIPRQRNQISINGAIYEFEPRFTLPKENNRTYKGREAVIKGGVVAGDDEKFTMHFYKPLGENPDRYIEYHPKQGVFLNQDNQTIQVHFRNIHESKAWRKTLWEEIRTECHKAWNTIQHLTHKFSERGDKELADKWGNDEEHGAQMFLMNRMIEHVFKNKRAKNKEKEILVAIARYEDAPELV